MPYDEHRDATRSMVRRVAVVEVDDSGDFQRLKLTGLAGEELKNVVRLHDFGFASNPPAGSEGLLMTQGGRADRVWAVGFEHQKYRQKDLPSGGQAIYDMAGNVIKMLVDGGVSHTTNKGDTSHATPNGKFSLSAKKAIGVESTDDAFSLKAKKDSSINITDGSKTITAAKGVNVNTNGNVSLGKTVAKGISSTSGLSTGALEVAADADGGLVQATMGLAVTGGATVDVATLSQLLFASLAALGPYTNDAAAATAGIPVGGAYVTTATLGGTSFKVLVVRSV